MEKVIYNVEIFLKILQYLNVEEQLQLAYVCKEFRHIIKSFLWRTTFKELQLYAIDTNAFIITNKVSNKKNDGQYTDPMFVLGYNDCEINYNVDKRSIILKNGKDVRDFVCINRNNIKKLQLLRDCNQDANETTQPFDFIWKYKFENLISIDLHGLSELSQSLKEFNPNCPKLKTLTLTKCYGNNTESILRDPNGISTIASLKTLKELAIFETFFGSEYDLSLILTIARKLKQLNEIVLHVTIRVTNFDDFNDVVIKEHLPQIAYKSLNLAALDLTSNNTMSMPAVIAESLLINFQVLHDLTISAIKSPLLIERNTLETFIKHCPSLKKVNLQYCRFQDFIPIPSLETLTLVNASGIKWQNFKTLLQQKNLQSFTTVFTQFHENFELFNIESPLQHLHIETMENDFQNDLRKLLEYNKKSLPCLRTLIWHDYTLWYPDEPIPLHLQLNYHYENLQSLFIDLAVVDIEDIMQMKSLKRLALIENDLIDVEKLLRVFQHPSVKNFTIYNRNLECQVKSYVDNFRTFKINLLTIEIPLHLFNCCTHILLELLAENVNLRIICYFYNENEFDLTFLKKLTADYIFPERIKTLKICGFTINRTCMQGNIDDIITRAKMLYKLLNRTMWLEL